MRRSDVFPRHHTVQVGETSTFVAEAGDGPPIVLLHGNPDSHFVWNSVVERLAPRHRCIAPDLPGWGQSHAAPDFDLSVEHQGAWLRGMLDHLQLPRVNLVVHDDGGVFGLAFATMHPERVRTLTIFDTLFFPDYRWHFWARLWRTPIVGELVMLLANRWLFVNELRRGSPHMPLDYANYAYDHFGRETKRMVLRWYRAMTPSVFTGWETRMLEATAQIPKQVVWGELDPYIPHAFADRFGAPVLRLPEVGHWVMQEAPDVAASAIADTVARG